MTQRIITATMATLVIATLGMTTGCQTVYGPQLGVFATPPIPVPAFFQDCLEDKAYEHERYERVPILGPLTAGGPAKALDPPTDDEVTRALEHIYKCKGGIPYAWTRNRNNVRVVKELIADYVDPPRVYPMVGPAQLHHAHYKCSVYYTEVVRVGWPIPYTTTDEEAQEVIYIDHNHLHMVGNVDTGACTEF